MKKEISTRPVPPPPFALVAVVVVVVIEIAIIWKYTAGFFSFPPLGNQKTQASVHYFAGKELLAQGKYRQAKPKFQQALRLNPDYSQAHINLGVCYFEEGNYEEAEKSFKTALMKIDKDVHNNIPVINHNLGSVYAELGEFDLAWDYYIKAYKDDPTSFNREKEQWLMTLLEQNNKEEFVSEKRKERVCTLNRRGSAGKGDYDLVGEISEPDPNPPYVGDKVSFTYVVRNQGSKTVPAGSFDVEFYVDGKLVSFDRCPPSLSNKPEGGVSYGKKEELSIELKPKDFYDFIPQAAGKYTYELIIDPKDKLKESNEENNKIIGEIIVLDNPPLRLWAIGWRDNVPAVDINNNILKEGDFIGGYTVAKIDKGFVTLSKDSQLSVLTFEGFSSQDQPVQKGPIQTFYNFYEELYKSTDFPLEHYMSKRWLAQFRALKYDLNRFLVESFPKKFIVVDEKIEGDRATVIADQEFKFDKPCGYVNEGGRMKPKYISVRRCTIRMVHEDGAWKIDSFGWSWW